MSKPDLCPECRANRENSWANTAVILGLLGTILGVVALFV